MKKQTFLAAATLAALLISGALYAQDDRAQNDVSVTQPIKMADKTAGAPSPDNVGAASTINLHAIKDFKTRFTHVADENWSRTDRGYAAYFTNDGYKMRAYYDAKGHWVASLTYCDEPRLPRFVRDIVKRTYYDLAITHVFMVEVPEHKAWVIDLEDKSTFKIVRVNEEGDMDELHDYVKLP